MREDVTNLLTEKGITSADKAISVADVMAELNLGKADVHVTEATMDFLRRQGIFEATADKKYFLK